MVSKCKRLKGVFVMFWGIINHDCALDSNLFVGALHYCAFNLLCENFDLGRFQSETRQQQQLPFILHGSHQITQWPALHPAATFLTWSNSSSSNRRKLLIHGSLPPQCPLSVLWSEMTCG